MTQRKLLQQGFTLVEIAIVLVIIGLLLGGILKGQELITQARIKSVISDFNGTELAYLSYMDRYRAIPGDDAGAGARWNLPDANAKTATAGDGIVQGAYNAAAATPESESRLFWAHLRQAGFIAGATSSAGSWPSGFADQPANAVTGRVGVTGQGTPLGFSGLVLCSANLPDKIALAVDAQIDNKNATSGLVRGMLQTPGAGSPDPGAAAPAGDYQETGQNLYLLCKSL